MMTEEQRRILEEAFQMALEALRDLAENAESANIRRRAQATLNKIRKSEAKRNE